MSDSSCGSRRRHTNGLSISTTRLFALVLLVVVVGIALSPRGSDAAPAASSSSSSSSSKTVPTAEHDTATKAATTSSRASSNSKRSTTSPTTLADASKHTASSSSTSSSSTTQLHLYDEEIEQLQYLLATELNFDELSLANNELSIIRDEILTRIRAVRETVQLILSHQTLAHYSSAIYDLASYKLIPPIDPAYVPSFRRIASSASSDGPTPPTSDSAYVSPESAHRADAETATSRMRATTTTSSKSSSSAADASQSATQAPINYPPTLGGSSSPLPSSASSSSSSSSSSQQSCQSGEVSCDEARSSSGHRHDVSASTSDKDTEGASTTSGGIGVAATTTAFDLSDCSTLEGVNWRIAEGQYSVERLIQLMEQRKMFLDKKEACLEEREKRVENTIRSSSSECECESRHHHHHQQQQHQQHQQQQQRHTEPPAYVDPDSLIHIIWTTDEDSFPGVGASINSVLRHIPHQKLHLIRIGILVPIGQGTLLRGWLLPHLDRLYGSAEHQQHGPYSPNFVPDWPFRVEIREFDTRVPPYMVRGNKLQHLNKDITFARLYAHEYFLDMRRYIYIDTDVVVRRDITELWDALIEYQTSADLQGRNILAAFRNCGAGYHHYFDMKNQFVLGRFVPRRCAFDTGIYMTNVADWIENNVTEQLNAWITLNQETPLYIGAVQAPMMALFYDRYDNIDGLSSLNWTHVTNLGVADHIAPELLASANSLEWSGEKKPWKPSGRAHLKYWSPYELFEPSYRTWRQDKEQSRQIFTLPGDAAALNVTGETLYEWLKSTNPSRSHLLELSDLLNVELHRFNGERQSGNILYLVGVLVVAGMAVTALLHYNPKQHRYEMGQLRRMGRHLRSARITKTINFTIHDQEGSSGGGDVDGSSDDEASSSSSSVTRK